MYRSDLSELDELVLMLLSQPTPFPPDDLVGIVRHYLGAPPPRRGHVDLLLTALARPEFDDDQLDDVRAAREPVHLQVRGARLAGLAARPGADVRALLRAERSLTARTTAARLTSSPVLLAELVVAAPEKLLVAALENPHHGEELDLAAIDLLEQPRSYLPQNVAGMLRRTPRVEARVRASQHPRLRRQAWHWCETPEENLAFAVEEVTAAVAAGHATLLIDNVLWVDEAVQLPTSLLRELEAIVDAELTALEEDDGFHAMFTRSDRRRTLEQVRRLLSTQADEAHPSVAVLLDRVLHADYGEATQAAEERVLAEATALLGHGAGFWPALGQAFDPDASIPDLVALAELLQSRQQQQECQRAVVHSTSIVPQLVE